MFTKRHEQELAEIKALTHELSDRFDAIQGQLQRIEDAQGGKGEPVDEAEPTPGPKARRAAAGEEAPKAKASGGKKARRQKAASEAGAATAGKRERKKQGSKQGKQGLKQGKQARRAAKGRSQPADENGAGDSGGAELASSPSSTEG